MRRALMLATFVILTAVASSAFALEIKVKEVGTRASVLSASIELDDLIPDRFKKLLDESGTLHLRVQAELWESRPVWDRLVYPATVRGVEVTAASRPPNPLALIVELGKSDRILASGRYYLHVIATLGTLAERDADDVGDAVFGKESESNTLGSLGRRIFRTALQINDYLQSVSAETRSRKLSGKDLLVIRP